MNFPFIEHSKKDTNVKIETFIITLRIKKSSVFN